MATHSSVLSWRIPGTEEPGALPSMGLHRVGHGTQLYASMMGNGMRGIVLTCWLSLSKGISASP